jgi:hypothetical protein
MYYELGGSYLSPQPVPPSDDDAARELQALDLRTSARVVLILGVKVDVLGAQSTRASLREAPTLSNISRYGNSL